ncbi:MAG: phosphoglucosamine mutase [Planctomycetota bacterium]|jgi:phosphoglucosamine mutase
MTSMTSRRIFGTDGIRGKAGDGWLSEERVSALGRAVGKIHLRHARVPESKTRPIAVLGHDGRESGPLLQEALARGLVVAGFDVTSCGLISSPGLALLTRMGEFGLGMMLSASHNPAQDNGIKIFSQDGEKLLDSEELEIETLLRTETEPETKETTLAVNPELERKYVDYLIGHAAKGLELGGMQVVIDCANGSGSHYAPLVLRRLGGEVEAIACAPDGRNINADCGSTHPENLRELVGKSGAAIGIALDGDADRCILVDERGELVDGDGILTVIAQHAMRQEHWRDPRIVATVMSNRGLYRAMDQVGVEVVECSVGDRAVVETLRREKLHLGGEQSGHIIFGEDIHYVGDGLYTALRVLGVMRATGKSLSELTAPFSAFPQVLLNIPVLSKPAISSLKEVCALVTQFEQKLAGNGRVLLRYSGTESLARVMVEGPEEIDIQAVAQEIATLLEKEIAASS